MNSGLERVEVLTEYQPLPVNHMAQARLDLNGRTRGYHHAPHTGMRIRTGIRAGRCPTPRIWISDPL